MIAPVLEEASIVIKNAVVLEKKKQMVLRALDDIQSMFAHIHPFLLSTVKACRTHF